MKNTIFWQDLLRRGVSTPISYLRSGQMKTSFGRTSQRNEILLVISSQFACDAYILLGQPSIQCL